jgi:hypothetical protein
MEMSCGFPLVRDGLLVLGATWLRKVVFLWLQEDGKLGVEKCLMWQDVDTGS